SGGGRVAPLRSSRAGHRATCRAPSTDRAMAGAWRQPWHDWRMDSGDLCARVEEFVRRHELIEPGGEILCLVSGGPDSTCLWHVLRSLGYRVSALHVNHGLRGPESEEDARFCRERFGAEVVEAP